MKEIKLKPCPFCGGEAKLKADVRYPRPERNPKRAYEVVCQNYNCIIGLCDDRYYLTEKEAIEAWNTRADTEPKR